MYIIVTQKEMIIFLLFIRSEEPITLL